MACTRIVAGALLLTGLAACSGPVFAAERVLLRNGFEFDCARQEPAGDRVRLYLLPAGTNAESNANAEGNAVDSDSYIEVSRAEIVRSEPLELPAPAAVRELAATASTAVSPEPTATEMRQMLAAAGEKHNLDADLLASVVKAESGGNTHAVSRAGAQGLMQLMPGTAAQLGVTDTFRADQNIGGGTAYLDQLLTRYRENIALALAAYNAGPAAVDKYHGVPPFAETRAYVARVIREFNRRKRVEAASAVSSVAAK